MMADLKKRTNHKNIFPPVSEQRSHSKTLSQYHLHVRKAVQPGKTHKEMEQTVHGGGSS